jgi:hypothetical protein
MKKIIGFLTTVAIFFTMTISLSAVETTTTTPTTTAPPTYQTVIPPTWVQTEPVVPGRPWENNEHFENADLYGNAELVEEEYIIFDSQEITFISVVTKSGNVFYVLIDHRIADKTKNVYFLNKVDEYDLLSLIYQDQTDEEGNPIAVPAPSTGQKEEVTTVSTEKTSENQKNTNTVKKEPVIPTLSIVILAIVALGGGAFGIWWITSKKKNNPNSSIDGYDDDDDDFYPEEKE